jgi:hypothetical protein
MFKKIKEILFLFISKPKLLVARTFYYFKSCRINFVPIRELPKISIIGSVFNADEHIEGYLFDITSQTIFAEKCELILINANSPGSEEELIKKYIKKFPNNIIYKKLDYDPGIYAVWNMAINISKGEYLTNANMDDRKSPYSLEKHAKALFHYKNVDLVYSDSYVVNKANLKWGNLPFNSKMYFFEQFSPMAMLRFNLPHNNPMWRRSLHDKFGNFNEVYRSASDWEFWLRCVCGGSKFKKLNEVLGVYYLNPKGMSTNVENESWRTKEKDEIFQRYSKIIC